MKTASILVLASVLFAVTVSAAPVLSVDNAAYDFGSVIEGTIVTHKFILTNTGDETLTISKVRASCGCTTTGLSDSTLGPGESVDLEARVDTTSFSGQIGKAVYVDSNDPATPTLTLRITGTVIKGDIKTYNVTPGDVAYLLYLLVDLRQPDEYAAGHLVGAVNIPYDELSQWIDRLPNGLLIVFYDQDGTDGDAAAEMLIAAGFSNVESLYGGLDNWLLQYGDDLLFSDE
jgi:rhodanese-related sulfurtransferase